MDDFTNLADVARIEAEGSWLGEGAAKTVYQCLTKTRDQYPNSNATSYQLLSGPNDKAVTLTWSQLHERVVQCANLLRELGIGQGDAVALILPNALETVYSILGGMIAGIVNPINPLLAPVQMSGILRESKAKVVITLKAFPKSDVAEKAAQAVRDAPDVTHLLEVDLNSYLTPPKSWIVPLIRPKVTITHHAKVLDFNKELARQPKTLRFEDPEVDRICAYFHTGGTTGTPKLAQHRNSGVLYNGWLGERLLISEDDVLICPLPLFHVFACHVILMALVSSGAHGVFPTPAGYRGEGVFDNFWKLVERWKVSFIITVPTAMAALMQRPVDADISSVKNAFSGSAPLPEELFKRFEKACGVEVVEGYGFTEATCLVSCNPVNGQKKLGSVGLRFPHCEIKIVTSEDGGERECAADEPGEICVSNPGVIPGGTYTEADRNVGLYYQERFIRTGDLGRIDSDGYLWITGRAKDLIIRGGHNIDPALIEEALSCHPAVAMAGAIGQPNAQVGELPCAYVELVADANNITVEELQSFCARTVAERAAVPKYIEILPELPKTAVGKVFKPELRKKAITRILNAEFEEKGLSARVEDVYEEKSRGLVAKIESDETCRGQVKDIMGHYSVSWEYS